MWVSDGQQGSPRVSVPVLVYPSHQLELTRCSTVYVEQGQRALIDSNAHLDFDENQSGVPVTLRIIDGKALYVVNF